MLEAIAHGLGTRDWNTLSASLPQTDGESLKSAAQRGMPSAVRAPGFSLPLRDWRYASMGAEDATAEIGEQHADAWRFDVKPIGRDDGLSIGIVDPAAKPDIEDGDHADRSMWVGIEMDRSVPKLIVAPDGGDNIATIWMTPDALFVENGEKTAVVGADGAISVRRTEDIDFEALGDTGQAADPKVARKR